MNNKKVINNLLTSVLELVNNLTSENLKDIESGNFELLLKVPEKNAKKQTTASPLLLDEVLMQKIDDELDTAKSRNEGLEIIESSLKKKTELVAFAKFIDVATMKSDRVDEIKNKIVDATVGARLRSGAIQGKEI